MAGDNHTTDGRSSVDAKSAFAEALGLSREVIARAEAGDQDAMKTVYAASGRGDVESQPMPTDGVAGHLALAVTNAADGTTTVWITARPATPSVPRSAND
ncbi:hypothetical protein ACMAUO_20455 [Gluconacetobacter sp. Hr-1-5]|uniref:hypothetical protein n=1 Tax=Gluconacetobacter sp. Hr-1-5 TaxID=3395370 RepID=UPI003B52ED8D